MTRPRKYEAEEISARHRGIGSRINAREHISKMWYNGAEIRRHLVENIKIPDMHVNVACIVVAWRYVLSSKL